MGARQNGVSKPVQRLADAHFFQRHNVWVLKRLQDFDFTDGRQRKLSVWHRRREMKNA